MYERLRIASFRVFGRLKETVYHPGLSAQLRLETGNRGLEQDVHPEEFVQSLSD